MALGEKIGGKISILLGESGLNFPAGRQGVYGKPIFGKGSLIGGSVTHSLGGFFEKTGFKHIPGGEVSAFNNAFKMPNLTPNIGTSEISGKGFGLTEKGLEGSASRSFNI